MVHSHRRRTWHHGRHMKILKSVVVLETCLKPSLPSNPYSPRRPHSPTWWNKMPYLPRAVSGHGLCKGTAIFFPSLKLKQWRTGSQSPSYGFRSGISQNNPASTLKLPQPRENQPLSCKPRPPGVFVTFSLAGVHSLSLPPIYTRN